MGSSASLVQHQELIDDYERNYLLSVKLKKNIKEDTVLLSAMENEERDCEVPGNVVTRPSADQPVPVVKKETFLRTELLLAVVPKFLEELSTFTSSYHGIDIATLEDAEKKAAREAVKHVDGVELSNIMPNKEWFSLFIKSVEKLFMCVSIATARADRPGFPLIYVNSAFEMSTGYDRKDIIGTNCKFLQSEKTDPQHIEQLSTALRTGTSTRVTIVNRRKDGTDFYNLLSMSPIYDQNGVYSYVLGVQRDLSQSQPTEDEIKLIDELATFLSKIPFSC